MFNGQESPDPRSKSERVGEERKDDGIATHIHIHNQSSSERDLLECVLNHRGVSIPICSVQWTGSGGRLEWTLNGSSRILSGRLRSVAAETYWPSADSEYESVQDNAPS
jgi:hypothetical protein